MPAPVVRAYLRTKASTARLRKLYLTVEHRSAYDNVFHCCVHKTGSQWMMSVLRDPMVYRYSGLVHHMYQGFEPESRPIKERSFDSAFPRGSIVSPLYITYGNYLALPKAGTARAFFVQRDPRDLLVSFYHSMRDTHIDSGLNTRLLRLRKQLQQASEEDGLRLIIDLWQEDGYFEALRSWIEQGPQDPTVRLIRYEDLIGPGGADVFRDLFSFVDIGMPAGAFDDLLAAYSFRKLTGRQPGEEDPKSHLRNATAGSWRGTLAPDLVEHLDAVTDGLPLAMGYRT